MLCILSYGLCFAVYESVHANMKCKNSDLIQVLASDSVLICEYVYMYMHEYVNISNSVYVF